MDYIHGHVALCTRVTPQVAQMAYTQPSCFLCALLPDNLETDLVPIMGDSSFKFLDTCGPFALFTSAALEHFGLMAPFYPKLFKTPIRFCLCGNVYHLLHLKLKWSDFYFYLQLLILYWVIAE